MSELLSSINSPADLQGLNQAQLDQLSLEIRTFLINSVSKTGGHLGPNLGVVELSIAIHRIFESPKDVILFDTGHQSYVHTLLTGRADGFEKLQVVPLLIITPLTFLGGSFYSISVLPLFWQKVALLNPVVYLISGFRWSFYSIEDVSFWISLGMTIAFLVISIGIVIWIFKTGYRLKK